MATKKKTTKRKSPSRSYGGKKKTVKRRKSRSGFISERFSRANMVGSAKATASGTVGGFIAGVIDNVTPNISPGGKVGIMLGASFITGFALNAPNMGAGIAGAAGYQLANMTGMLSDDSDMQQMDWANPLEQLPMFLDEDGNEMLAEMNDYTPGYSTAYGGYN